MQRRWATRQFKTRAGVALAEFVSHRKGRRIVDFRDDWSDACTAAGVTGLHFHDLRRSAVRNMDMAGPQEPASNVASIEKGRRKKLS
jgi:integrase